MNRVPPRVSGASDRPRTEETEQLEELGADAIIAEERGAHLPQPRAQVTEEARSIVISEHASPGSNPPASKGAADGTRRKRSERTEKTVVIRDRRQIEDLRREMERRKAHAPAASQGLLLWVIVGVAAFAVGGLIALFATHEDSAAPALAKPPVPSGNSFR